MKTCSKCKIAKPFDEFTKDKQRRDGKSIHCRECIRITSVEVRKRNNAHRTAYNREYREKHRKHYNEWERNYFAKNKETMNEKSKKWRTTRQGTFVMLHLAAQSRARKKKIEYTLSADYIEDLCNKQEDKCALTGITFTYECVDGFRVRPFAPSLDRKDSSKGYTPDNVQITCVIVNKAKNEYTQEIFDLMCYTRMRELKMCPS